MRWVRDETGRLPRRPHFLGHEIDRECESLVAGFLRQPRGTPGLGAPARGTRREGATGFGLTTDDLTVLLERETADLDLYADLSAEGPDVEGVTDFFPGEPPRVRIAAALSERPGREHRLRTTLAHELGHVRLHTCLWALDGPAPLALNPRCRRSGISHPEPADWLEWQAGYACGALLMPAGEVQRAVAGTLRAALGATEPAGPLHAAGTLAGTLTRRIARDFDVSTVAARVRLLKLGYLAGATVAGGNGPTVKPRLYVQARQLVGDAEFTLG